MARGASVDEVSWKWSSGRRVCRLAYEILLHVNLGKRSRADRALRAAATFKLQRMAAAQPATLPFRPFPA
jgi:hypothetical protein